LPKLIANTLEAHDVEDVAVYLPRMLHMLVSAKLDDPEYLHLKTLADSLMKSVYLWGLVRAKLRRMMIPKKV